jgi:hypothetical protein
MARALNHIFRRNWPSGWIGRAYKVGKELPVFSHCVSVQGMLEILVVACLTFPEFGPDEERYVLEDAAAMEHRRIFKALLVYRRFARNKIHRGQCADIRLCETIARNSFGPIMRLAFFWMPPKVVAYDEPNAVVI